MFKKVRQLDRNIWIRFGGETITGIMMFMIAPFLVLYYADKLDSYMLVGIIMATGPIAALLGSMIGGRLSDIYGRKPLMVIAIVGDAAVLIGFAFAESFWPLLLLNAALGLTNSLFHPAASAMVADVTEPEQLNEAFGLLRMGHNVGAAFGPLLGSAVLFIDRSIIFFSASALFVVYAIILLVFIVETKPENIERNPEEKLVSPFVILSKDKVFLAFVGAGIFISMGFSLVESMLPVFLKESLPGLPDSQNPFPYLMGLNGLMVVLLQFPIAAKLSGKPFGKVMLAGATVFGIGMILLAIVPAFLFELGTNYFALVAILLVIYALYTFGEMIMSPVQMTFIALIAPEDMRGTYNGAASIQWLIGSVTAPLLGSFFLEGGSGGYVLAAVGLACIVSGFVYLALDRAIQKTARMKKTA
ncbi:MDR family MFS transporter [Exiguobacterium flavidum]|uniref:MDR family MFS transporter n=1 Tax=Exiguobacterium flavidum TaxID=2184695 RepID=UPI000DF72984|nr:MFS transporter [Exiguobacterium flavidum]